MSLPCSDDFDDEGPYCSDHPSQNGYDSKDLRAHGIRNDPKARLEPLSVASHDHQAQVKNRAPDEHADDGEDREPDDPANHHGGLTPPKTLGTENPAQIVHGKELIKESEYPTQDAHEQREYQGMNHSPIHRHAGEEAGGMKPHIPNGPKEGPEETDILHVLPHAIGFLGTFLCPWALLFLDSGFPLRRDIGSLLSRNPLDSDPCPDFLQVLNKNIGLFNGEPAFDDDRGFSNQHFGLLRCQSEALLESLDELFAGGLTDRPQKNDFTGGFTALWSLQAKLLFLGDFQSNNTKASCWQLISEQDAEVEALKFVI